METGASSSPPPASSLRHRLRATVCCCFGVGDRAQWGRRRVGVGGEFRYDPLSYALNFDEGDDDGEYETSIDDFGDGDGDGGLLVYGTVYRGFSSPPRARAAAVAAA